MHITSVRSADEGDKSPPPIEPEKSTASDSSGAVNSQKNEDAAQQTAESNSLPTESRESPDSEQGLAPRQKEQQTVFNDETSPADRTRLSDEEFHARRRERLGKLKEIPSLYNFPRETVRERNAVFRQTVYDRMKLTSDEAALRGEKIFEEVNRKRKERGEPELSYYRNLNEKSMGLQGSAESPAGKSYGGPPRRTGFGRGNGRNPGRSSYDRRGGTAPSERLQERMDQYQELQKPHVFSKNFEPWLAAASGHDEVDFEIDPDELPDALRKKSTSFTIDNRDGTTTPGRKTNRDFDDLPEEEQIYIPIGDVGGPSQKSFYGAPLDQILSVENEILSVENQIELLEEQLEGEEPDEDASRNSQRSIEGDNPKNKFDESSNEDLNELMKVKEEIEKGKTPQERELLRKKRESDRLYKELDRLEKAEGASGQWVNPVPLPQPHKPETADLDDYVAPVFNHESFKYQIPALPFGSQGRLAAAREVSFHLTDSFIPADLTPEKISDFKAMQSNEQHQKSLSEMTDILDTMSFEEKEDRPIPPFNRRAKVRNPPKSSARPGPVFDLNREVQIEDLYSDTQLAIWKEMHAGAFPPPDYKLPSYEEEEGALTLEQEMEEDEQRIKVMEMVDTMEATALTMFRQRDEFVIRDIRRKLGLPIVNNTYMAEPYHNKSSLDGTPPSIFV
jgi:hypothetical protein